MNAIEQIIAGYVSPRESSSAGRYELREHRQRLLERCSSSQSPGFRPTVVNDTLREEI